MLEADCRAPVGIRIAAAGMSRPKPPCESDIYKTAPPDIRRPPDSFFLSTLTTS